MQPFDHTKAVEVTNLQNLMEFLIRNGFSVARPISVEERPRWVVSGVLQRRLQLHRGHEVLRSRLLHTEVRSPGLFIQWCREIFMAAF